MLKAWSLDTARSCLLGLIAPAIVLVLPLGCVCIFIPLWLVTEFDASIWVLIVFSSLYLLILVGGGIGATVWVLLRRKRRLDAAFTPLGLAGGRYMLTGRQYHGAVDGRRVSARFYRGPTLEVRLSTPLETRFGIAEEGTTTLPLARLAGRQPLDLEALELSGLHVFARDEGWTRSLLADPEARTRIRRLMNAAEDWALVRQVVLEPGAFCLRLYRSRRLFTYEIRPEDVRQWLDDLHTLARIAEGVPIP
ncbi:MAG: hypothetical protein PVI59_16055 [Anaerolineae bacterium]|jgi:hypothetical protein